MWTAQPPSEAVGGHVLSSGGVPGAVGSQPQFVRVTPEGVMAGQGNQQGPPPYNPDEQVRTCFCFIYLFFFVDLVFGSLRKQLTFHEVAT